MRRPSCLRTAIAVISLLSALAAASPIAAPGLPEAARTPGVADNCFEGWPVPTFTTPGQFYTDDLSISRPGDVDWYSVNVETGTPAEGATLRIETISDNPDNPFEDDTRLSLYTDCDTTTGDGIDLIESDDDSGQGFMSLINTACLETGTYYLRVNGWEEISLAENITLEIESTSVCGLVVPDSFEPDDDRSEAGEIPAADVQAKSIAPDGDQDWSWFDLAEPRLMRIKTSGTGVDTALGLHYATENVPVRGLCNNTGDPDVPAGTITTVITNGCNENADCPDNINPVDGLPDCLPWDSFVAPLVNPVDNVLASSSGGESVLTLCLPSTVRPSESESVDRDPADPFHWFVRTTAASPGLDCAVTGGTSCFDYEFRLEDLGPCEYESSGNDGPGSADPLPADGSISGIFDYSGFTPDADNDFYSFDVSAADPETQAKVFEIAVSSANPNADSFIELFVGPDESDEFFLVAADDDGGPGLLSRIEVGLPPATYQANVTAAFVGPNFPYELTVTELDNVFGEIGDFGDCHEDFPAFGTNGSRYLAAIGGEGCDYDGFTIRLETDRDLTIITDSAGDTTVQLVDCTTEEILGCDDDTNSACASGFCSQIDGCLPGGHDYCVRVRPFSSDSSFAYEIDVRDNGDCTAQDPPVVDSDLANACADTSGAAFNAFLGCNSDYVYAECVEPRLLVTMQSLTATQTSGGVAISWTTATEVDTVGFRVLREDLGSREKARGPVAISPWIQAAGSSLQGATYTFVDSQRRGAKSSRYWVEDLDAFNRPTLHGPILFVPRTRR